MKKVFLPLMLAFVVMLASCSQHLGNFSALSTGNFDGKNINQKSLVKKNAEGNTKKMIILGIPLGQPKVDEAVADALRQNDGDFIMNGSLYYKYWTIVIYGEFGYEVKGDVYKTQQ